MVRVSISIDTIFCDSISNRPIANDAAHQKYRIGFKLMKAMSIRNCWFFIPRRGSISIEVHPYLKTLFREYKNSIELRSNLCWRTFLPFSNLKICTREALQICKLYSRSDSIALSAIDEFSGCFHNRDSCTRTHADDLRSIPPASPRGLSIAHEVVTINIPDLHQIF